MRCVRYWQTALAMFAALCASIALAEDFKTIKGKEYKNATVTHVEPDGLVLKTKAGISKVYFTELPKDLPGKSQSPRLHNVAHFPRLLVRQLQRAFVNPNH